MKYIQGGGKKSRVQGLKEQRWAWVNWLGNYQSWALGKYTVTAVLILCAGNKRPAASACVADQWKQTKFTCGQIITGKGSAAWYWLYQDTHNNPKSEAFSKVTKNEIKGVRIRAIAYKVLEAKCVPRT